MTRLEIEKVLLAFDVLNLGLASNEHIWDPDEKALCDEALDILLMALNETNV